MPESTEQSHCHGDLTTQRRDSVAQEVLRPSVCQSEAGTVPLWMRDWAADAWCLRGEIS